jgi:hypothetical protein
MEKPSMLNPKTRCCDDAVGFVEWKERGLYGPDSDGWCIPTGEDYGATTYTNIRFCPLCGKRLQE